MHNLVQPYCNGAGVTYDWLEKAWRPDNTDGGYPRLLRSQTGHDNYEKANTFWLRDASYLRLKNLVIGYTLPKKWMDKICVQNCRVYVSGENLITWTPFMTDYIDPEQPIADSNGRSYPLSKTFSVGLDITF